MARSATLIGSLDPINRGLPHLAGRLVILILCTHECETYVCRVRNDTLGISYANCRASFMVVHRQTHDSLGFFQQFDRLSV